MTSLAVNLDLVRKYSRPGPRYTSYPTAPQFVDDFDRARLAREMDAAHASSRPLSLYIHVPFCETLCWYCGCTQVTTTDRSRCEIYLRRLETEIRITALAQNSARHVVQLHFGGGTPNYLSPDQIGHLGAILHEHFNFDPSAEISVELDPRRLTREHVAAFRALGVNRASLGVQDFHPFVQEAINRVQPEELVSQAVDWLREAGIHSINFDLIYGLPYQTPATFHDTVIRAARYAPDRLAVFHYAHVPFVRPGQKALPVEALPKAEAKFGMLKGTIETLTDLGWAYIGLDHFAREDDELTLAQRAGTLQRNFQGYSTHGDSDVLAFGMSAISQTTTHYRQNHKILPHYHQAVDRGELPIVRACFLTRDDQIRRTVIMRLMCTLELNYHRLSVELGIDFCAYFATELKLLAGAEQDGLVERAPHCLRVTDEGRLFLRNLAMHFDAYLDRSPAKYSSTC